MWENEAGKMTDVQLYLATGIPSLLFGLNFLAILSQARGLTLAFNVRIDSLETVMKAKFEVLRVFLKRTGTVVNCLT